MCEPFGIEYMVRFHITSQGQPKEELYDAVLEVAAYAR
jgi:hypothetical protein